jgi:hypothetical protein
MIGVTVPIGQLVKRLMVLVDGVPVGDPQQ